MMHSRLSTADDAVLKAVGRFRTQPIEYLRTTGHSLRATIQLDVMSSSCMISVALSFAACPLATAPA